MKKRRAGRKILALLASGLLVAVLQPVTPAYAVPVRIEAEDSTIVLGAAEAVHAGFSGTGYVNTDNVVGSGVEWLVVSPSTGPTNLAIRYANGQAVNRPMSVSVNGTVVNPAMAFNGTGAWTTYATATLTAALNTGPNTVRLMSTTAGGGPNVDYVEADVSVGGGTEFQAENATLTQAVVESNHAGFTGTGFVNYNNAVGSAVEWNVDVTSGGPSAIVIRYANGSTIDRPMDIAVNGTVIANGHPFGPTGAWSTWTTATFSATLRAGANSVKATATTAGGGPNVDRLNLGGDSERPTVPGQPSCSNIGTNSLTLSWGAATDNVGVAAYDIFHEGTKISEAPGNATTRNLTGLNPNFEYRLSVFARDAAGNVSDSSAQAICRTLPVTNDTQPPTAPSNLVHSNVGQTTVNLTWTGSTDNVGVTAYLVRNASNAVVHTVTGNPPATSTTVPNLACNINHTLHVVARDAAGNISAASNTRSFTTGMCGRGQPSTPQNVSTGWTIPWDIDWAPSGQFALITERDHFRVWRVGLNGQKQQVGTVPNSVTTNGEGGLMGVAFSPDWNGTTDQEVFFMHTSNDGGATQNRVVKMSFNGSTLTNRQVILAGIRSNRFHNGGRIKFGPDGFLYVTAGDAQQDNNGQNRDALNGKILRITKTGAAAPGNPFGTRIYSWGHRNPQGLAWDSAGRLWSSELMNNANDELNLILPGRNYGWPTCQGSCNVAGMENPKRTWGVAEASPSGIAIVNDTVYMAALRGQRLWRIELNGTSAGTTTSHFQGTFGRLRAVSKIPGFNAIWIGTTNADNNGGAPDGADRIMRSNIG